MYEDILREKGIDSFGTAILPEGFSPFSSLSYALSFMVPLPRELMRSIQKEPTALYFHHYRTINTYLDQTAMQIVLNMTSKGYNAVYVPASQSDGDDGTYALLSHKAVARMAGLGSIGKNALFLSKKYGPAVRLSTVLTDQPLLAQELSEDLCTGCDACVHACPIGALTGRQYKQGMRREDLIDAKQCSVYMKQKYSHITRGNACGLCIANCPLTYE